MAKKKKEPMPNISKEFLDALLYSSWRYFIGRHTIHASCHAPDMAKFFEANPDLFSHEHLKFNAKDIRDCCNTILNFSDCIHVSGYDKCAYTLLCKKLDEIAKSVVISPHDDIKEDIAHFVPNRYMWTIDLYNDTVTYRQKTPEELSKTCSGFWENMRDLLPWVKLANYLDPPEMIHMNTKDHPELGDEYQPGFEYPIWGRYEGEETPFFKMVKTTIANYIQKPYIDSYLAPEAMITT